MGLITCRLLAAVGGGSLAFGTDFAASTASKAAFAEHMAQLNRRVSEGRRSGTATVCGHRR